jgi:hypothetical protein
VTQKESTQLVPPFVSSVTGELKTDYWQPQSFQEWTEMTRTSAFLTVWVEQQSHERALRKVIGVWVFVLITLQVVGVFALVVLDACHVFQLNQRIVEFLIPSVLAEVFGMGYVVIKYLFRANTKNPFEVTK